MDLESILREKKALVSYNLAMKTELNYLRPMQIQCLREAMKCDLIAIMPTGYGKSLVYELLPFYCESVKNISYTVIVTVPLNSIIDQELEKLGGAICRVKQDISLLPKKTFYIGHPEDILNSATNIFQVTRNVEETFIIVDEAHCVLEWGDDFRPDYRLIADLRTYFDKVKLLALTATASRDAQNAIASYLGMKNFISINSTPALNPNISIFIQKRIPSTGGNNSVIGAYDFVFKPLLLELIQLKERFPLTIIYTKLQWCGYGVELASRLVPSDILNPYSDLPSVVQYHAQQPKEINQAIVNAIARSDSPIKLVFATVALGMGCDLRCVKRVVHAGPPSCMEVYVQEIGRAGRDGSQAEAILYWNATDLGHDFIDKSFRNFCKSQDICRRDSITQYFNTVYTSSVENCCDICMGKVSSIENFTSPKLTQRQIMRDSLRAYVSIDTTNTLSDHLIMIITDVYEHLQDSNQIQDIFDIPEHVAETVLNIKHAISAL